MRGIKTSIYLIAHRFGDNLTCMVVLRKDQSQLNMLQLLLVQTCS